MSSTPPATNNNFRNGIFLGRLSFDNTVNLNTVTRNAGSGIYVSGPSAPSTNPSADTGGAHDNTLRGNNGRNNGEFDGTDLNPMCDNNQWVANVFQTSNQPCVGGTTGGPVIMGAAVARSQHLPFRTRPRLAPGPGPSLSEAARSAPVGGGS